MRWYAVHAIIRFAYRRRADAAAHRSPRARIPIWEKVYLVSGKTPAEARRMGSKLAKSECADDPAQTLDGKPSRMVFAGIRAVVSMAAPVERAYGDVRGRCKLHAGVEATFLKYEVTGMKALRALVRGEAVSVQYFKVA